jgi:hypothetical protein
MIGRSEWLAALLVLVCEGAGFCESPTSPMITIHSAPEHPIVEARDSNRFLNFDMAVRNVSGLTLRISQIELSVYDSAHQLALRKSINTDAFAPSKLSDRMRGNAMPVAGEKVRRERRWTSAGVTPARELVRSTQAQMRSSARAARELFRRRVYVHTAYLRGLRPRRAVVLRVAKEFVVMLPVALDFAHDALEFGIPAQVLPVLVALVPRKIMISKLNGSFQPGESWLLLSQ